MISVIPTPHNEAKKTDIASKVIMPGDPKRAEFIAKNFLKKVKLVNTVRGALAYTGYFENTKVTVMAHGMGIPSIGIYAYELFKFYDVDVIYRIGSAGSMNKKLKVGTCFLVKEAWSNSAFAWWLKVKSDKPNLFYPAKACNAHILKTAKAIKLPIKEHRIISSDCFYTAYSPKDVIRITKGAQATEMESFGLFAIAKKLHKKAACLLTISDSLVSKERPLTSSERVTTFKNMMKIALKSIISQK